MPGGVYQGDDKERVKAASDIVEVVREHLSLVPKGREYVTLCPFHDDHKPSMFVVPGKQMFHCFSCGATGNVFDFVMRYLGLEFREALKLLAERAGIELTRRSGPLVREDDGGVPLEDVREALALATEFYRAVYHKSEQGRASREMVRARGINDEMVERFAIGAAPDEWERLGKALRGKGVSDEAMVAAGIAKRRDSGGCFDMIRNRLVFPIHAAHGKTVAFGGRKLNPEDEPKYLNTPETAVFKKGRLLYGLYQSMPTIIKTGTVVVVEGYIDVIACHQHGFTNVVGTMGTALTAEHARLLRGRATRVVLLFDNDEAGRRAAFRAGEVFFAEPLDVRVASAPVGPDGEASAKDPDELLAEEGGREAFATMLERAGDVMELRFAALRERVAGAGPAAMAAAVEQELGRLVELGLNEVSPLRRRHIVLQVARVLGMSAHDVETMTPKGRSAARRARVESAGGVGAEGPEGEPGYRVPASPSTFETLLGCVLCCPWLVMGEGVKDRDAIRPEAYPHPLLAKVAHAVLSVAGSGSEPGLEAVSRALGDDRKACQAAMALAHTIDHIHRGGGVTKDGAHPERGSAGQASWARVEAAWGEGVRRVRQGAARGAGGVGVLPMSLGEVTGGSSGKAGADAASDLVAMMKQSVERKRTLGSNPSALPRPLKGLDG